MAALAPLTLLDASALISLIGREPAEKRVKSLLRAGKVGITPVNLTETVEVLLRVYGTPLVRIHDSLDYLIGEVIKIVPFEEHICWRAAEIRSTTYSKSKRPLSLADAVLLAAGEHHKAVATSDRLVIQTAKTLGVETVALPSSTG